MPLSIPQSSATVKVGVINPTQVLDVPAEAFLTPSIPGTTYSDTPCLSFVIEHAAANGQISRLVFDLGIRKDWEKLPASVVEAVKSMNISIMPKHDVADTLESHAIDLASIHGIIFSHWHFDHVGDATRFPKSSRLIVGPGFKKACLPGYPTNPDSQLCEDGFEGRDLEELEFEASDLRISGLRALDWFGDGSFYLLNTPGHAVGHISALARATSAGLNTSSDDTFIFLAGDVCHHAGELRPHEALPLPVTLTTPSQSKDRYKHMQEYRNLHPYRCTDKPFYQPSSGGFNLDAEMMKRTADKVAAFDADPRVFVMLAHDHWLLDVIEPFPEWANEWKERDWDTKARWRFLQDFE